MRSPWLQQLSPGNSSINAQIFCIPYAGGTVAAFRPLLNVIDRDIALHVASLPGRGTRFVDPPCNELRIVIKELCDAIETIRPGRFVLYGHSMGGLLSYEVARELRRRGNHFLPEALVVSGARAPHLFAKDEDEVTYNLPREAFIQRLDDLEGTPKEFFEHPELMDLMLPFLRADFEISETYQYKEEVPLNMPILAFSGTEDSEVGRDNVSAWSMHTHKSFSIQDLQGGHFFLHDHWKDIGEALNHFLKSA